VNAVRCATSCKLQATGYRLQATGYKLQVASYGVLPTFFQDVSYEIAASGEQFEFRMQKLEFSVSCGSRGEGPGVRSAVTSNGEGAQAGVE
jgi:hypothetical protein